MALSAVARRVLRVPDIALSVGAYGVIAQADGSYLAGYSQSADDYPYTTSSHWLRSTDEGESWDDRGSSIGILGQASLFPANLHENIVCAPFGESPSLDAGLVRSTNGANSWSEVFRAASASTPNGRTTAIFGVLTFGFTKAICWGELDGDNRNTPQIYGLSTNGGLSWTPYNTWDAGDQYDVANAMGVAEGGTIYCQYTKFGGINRTSNFARSDDGGATWTVLGPPPGGTQTPPNTAQAITCFDKDNLAIGGLVNTYPSTNPPGIWWSDDAGDSLHLVPASDVADWPSGSFNSWVWEIKRFTKQACLLAVDQQNGTPGSPWRISYDQAHTFPIAATLAEGSWPIYQIPYGTIVQTKDNALLCPVLSSEDYTLFSFDVYRVELKC